MSGSSSFVFMNFLNEPEGARPSLLPAALLLAAFFSCPLEAQQYRSFSSEMDNIKSMASWRLGPFNILSHVFFNYGYDSNLYGVVRDKGPVTANYLSVGLPTTIVFAFRGWLIFDVTASPTYEYFFDIPTERALNIGFSPRMKALLFHRIVVSGTWQRGRNRSRPSSEIDRRVWLETDGYWLSLFYDTPRQTSLGFSAYSTRFKFESIALPGSSVPLSTALNRQEKNAKLEFYYRLSQGTFFFTNIGFSKYSFSSNTSSFRDSHSYQANMGIRFPLLGRAMGTISLGYKKLVPIQSQSRGFSGIVGNTDVDFRVGRFAFRVGFIRDAPFSYSEKIIYIIDQAVRAGASFYLSQRIRLDYGFSYGDSRYPQEQVPPAGGITPTGTPERHDLRRSHTVGVAYRIFRRIGIGLNAVYWDRDSDFYQQRISRTAFGASLIYQF
jgi:hypothetical protein